MNLQQKLKSMAQTPRQQLKRLLKGTFAATGFALLLLLTSQWELRTLFYLLAFGLIVSILYALPGYLGIWLWRMRRFLFDIKDD